MKRTQNRINKTRNDSWEDKKGDIHELRGLTNNPVHPRPSKGKKKKGKYAGKNTTCSKDKCEKS